MRLLVTAFYRDSARYFAALAQHVSRTLGRPVALEAISIYPCAQRYFDDHGIRSTYAPAIRSAASPRHDIADEALVQELISFHSKTYRYFCQDRDAQLAAIARGYVAYLEDLFRARGFDRTIVFGSSRLLPKAVEHVARGHGVPLLYFEQAPFGRTILDPSGVGPRMSIPPAPSSGPHPTANLTVQAGRSAKVHYWKSEAKTLPLRLAQAQSFLQSFQPRSLQPFLAADLYTGPFALLPKRALAKRRLRAQRPPVARDLGEPSIALFLQTPVDAQFFEDSPHYDDFTQMVADVIAACPPAHRLVLREHPEHLGCYSPQLYELIEASPGVILDNVTPFGEVLSSAALVVVNNSTVGFQALAAGKKVLVLGNAFYAGRGLTYDLSDRAELPELIRQALRDDPDPELGRSFVAHVLTEVFFPGHFQDRDLEFDPRLTARVVNGA